MKRIVIKWETISENLCEGEAIIDEWRNGQFVVDTPIRTAKIPVSIQNGTISMKNLPIHVTEELLEELSSMIRIYYSAVNRKTSCYKWLDVKRE
jgi:hypothetical protein